MEKPMTTTGSYRFYGRSPDGEAIFGFETLEGASVAALEYGEGAFVVDISAQAYNPMLHEVREGEVKITGFGGWGAGRTELDLDFIGSLAADASKSFDDFLWHQFQQFACFQIERDDPKICQTSRREMALKCDIDINTGKNHQIKL